MKSEIQVIFIYALTLPILLPYFTAHYQLPHYFSLCYSIPEEDFTLETKLPKCITLRTLIKVLGLTDDNASLASTETRSLLILSNKS